MRKRLLAIIAVAAMVVTMIPAMAFADATTLPAPDSNGVITLTENVTLSGDVVLADGNYIKVTKGSTITLDLNGHSITGKDVNVDTGNSSANFALISSAGTLTIKDSVGNGKITLSAINDRQWNSSSSVIDNNQGTLVIESGYFEHLGGTDMAYVVNTLTNGNLGDATTTINGGTFKSTYRAVRMFANSTTCENNLTINGGDFEGTSAGIWLQSSNANANMATLDINNGTISSENRAVYAWAPEGGNTEELKFELGEAASVEGKIVFTEDFDLDNNVDLPSSFVAADPNKPFEFTGPQKSENEQNKTEAPDKSPATGDNTALPFAVAGLVMAVMAAVVATRRRTN